MFKSDFIFSFSENGLLTSFANVCLFKNSISRNSLYIRDISVLSGDFIFLLKIPGGGSIL